MAGKAVSRQNGSDVPIERDFLACNRFARVTCHPGDHKGKKDAMGTFLQLYFLINGHFLFRPGGTSLRSIERAFDLKKVIIASSRYPIYDYFLKT